MEVINLKTPLTFRIDIEGRKCAFQTKTFKSKLVRAKIPEQKEYVTFEVTDIVIDSTNPWFTLTEPITISIIWSNVLSVQYEKE